MTMNQKGLACCRGVVVCLIAWVHVAGHGLAVQTHHAPRTSLMTLNEMSLARAGADHPDNPLYTRVC